MRRDDSIFLIETQENAQDIFKMTKTRTAMFLVMIVLSCALIFSITDAYPTPESETSSEPDTKIGNNSRLVITHVVKTIEFEVGLVDGDDIEDENSTDSNASEFYETDIQLLNVDLLKEVVNQVNGTENYGETIELVPENENENEKTEGTEGRVEQMQNETLTEKSTS